jgi:hypothetical protein
MDIFDIAKSIGVYGSSGLLVILTILEIAPIKINPWSWIARSIGRALNREVMDEMGHLREDVKNNREYNDQEWVDLRRTHILRFGDEIRMGISHSEEHFDQVLLDISKYKRYCKAHPQYLNDRASATITIIENAYKKCLEEDKFL